MRNSFIKKTLLTLVFLIVVFVCGGVNAGELDGVTEKQSFEYAKSAIRQKAEDVARQIEIYIKLNPLKTVKDLQDDEYFKNIAVQAVGQTGYTAVTDYQTLVARFHKNGNIINMDLHSLSDKLPGFWDIMSRTEGGKASDGVYDWEEKDGSVKQKYMYIAIVGAKTIDGVGFSVAATTYLDEYNKGISLQQKNENYEELSIKLKALQVAKQIDDYLLEHPEKSLEDLQMDNDFQKIAVQIVGETGYTGIVDSQSGFFYFHPRAELVNTDAHKLKEKLPDFWNIFANTIGEQCQESSGYYEWKEADGTKTKKYLYDACIENTTADGRHLFVGATTYINEIDAARYLGEYNIKEDFSLARDSINQRAIDISKQVELYIEAHPQKTLADLEQDEEFQNLAVQTVGKTGYTYLVVHETGVLDFHPDPKIRNTSYDSFKEKFPTIWGIIDKSVQAKPCQDSQGFYKWADIEGVLRDKYTYHHCVDAYTADGFSFFLGASTYLDEYEQQDIKIEEILVDDTELNSSLMEELEKEKKLFNDLITANTESIKDTLEQFMSDNSYKQIFLKHDREALYDYSLGLFEKNKKENKISHFYYIGIDGEIFLRVHNKDIFGDIASRQTFEQSQKTSSWGSGIELGKTAFALRVVHPYIYDGKTIAYVEFSKDVDNLLLTMKQQTGHEFGAVVKKEYVDEAKWASVRKVKNLRNNYNDFEKYVVIDSTDESNLIFAKNSFDDKDITAVPDSGSLFHKIILGDKTIVTGGFPLYDAGGNKIGAIVTEQDVSKFVVKEDSVLDKNFNEEEKGDYIAYIYFFFISLGLVFIFIALLYYFKIIRLERTTLYIILLLAFLLITGMFVFSSYSTVNKLKANFKTSYIDQHLQLENLLIDEIVALVDDMSSELLYLADTIEGDDMENHDIVDLLKSAYERKSDVAYAVYRTNKDSVIANMYPFDKNFVGSDISEQKHMQKIKNNLEPAFSDIFDTAEGFQSIALHFPLIKNSEYDGTVAFLINIDNFFKKLSLFSSHYHEHDSFLVDTTGAIISSDNKEYLGKNIYNIEKYQVVKDNFRNIFSSDKAGTEEFLLAKKKVIATFTPIEIFGNKWFLLVIGFEEDAYYGLGSAFNSIWIFTLLALLLFIVFGILFSYFLTRSLRVEVERKTFKIKEDASLIKEQLKKEELITKEKEELLVKQRQAKSSLEEKVGELEKFQRLTVDRELKMIELKDKIRDLSSKK